MGHPWRSPLPLLRCHGLLFRRGENGVLLTDTIAPRYLPPLDTTGDSVLIEWLRRWRYNDEQGVTAQMTRLLWRW
jgi:hypothetical protein